MVDTLLRGSVDAINVAQPFHYIALSTGKVRVLGYPFLEIQPGMHIAPYAATAAWLEANPNTVKGFMKAMTKAVEFLRANPDEAKKLIGEFTGAKPELIQAVPLDEWSTTLSTEDIERTLQVMKQEGVLKKELKAKDLVFNVPR
jgi:NitT/TauT family transport system substrate-binding protein